MLMNLLHHYLRFWLSSTNRIDKESFFEESVEIIGAIKESDEERLRAASSKHIEVSLEKVMRQPIM
jgi:DNA-binding GntR family transcriptional regulator